MTRRRRREESVKFVHRQFLQLAGAFIAVLGASASLWGAELNVVGSGKLVSFASEELATGKKTAMLGERPKGYLMYTPEGRMMTVVVHENRSPPKVDEDRINLHKYNQSGSVGAICARRPHIRAAFAPRVVFVGENMRILIFAVALAATLARRGT
jgi:hypothetical protein